MSVPGDEPSLRPPLASRPPVGSAAGSSVAGTAELGGAPTGPSPGVAEGPPHTAGVGGQVAVLAGELSDRVIEAVAWLRARTTVRLVTALRALVYGSVALVALVTAAVLGTLSVVRIWDAYVPVHPVATRVWLGYVVFGAVLFLPGAWLVRSRRASK